MNISATSCRRRTVKRCVVGAFCVALLAVNPIVAQQRVAGSAAALTARDSAGIRIVEHDSFSNAPIAFRVERTPFLSLGGLAANVDDELYAHHPYLSGRTEERAHHGCCCGRGAHRLAMA